MTHTVLTRHSFPALLLLLSLIVGCDGNHTAQHSASDYAGHESREIKAMTAEEVRGYLEGEGMGLSLVAELNHYPGPRHVLDLAGELDLSVEQRTQAEAIYDHMKTQAVERGKRYIAAEQELNSIFDQENASAARVDSLLTEIGILQGRLRAVHINAHIEMKQILKPQQINRYDELRGYNGGDVNEGHITHDHHRS